MKDKAKLSFLSSKLQIESTELAEDESIENILLMGLQKPLEERDMPPISPIKSYHEERKRSRSPDDEYQESTKLCQKLEAIDFKDIDEYASLFVDEIIAISVAVCKKTKTVLDDDIEQYSYEIDEVGEDDIQEELPKSIQIENIFPGWPNIGRFNLELGMKRIDQFMSLWKVKEAWKYSIFHIASWSDFVSDFHLFKIQNIILLVVTQSTKSDNMYMSNRIAKVSRKLSRPEPNKRSMDDIDELTYMLMLGTKGEGRKSTSGIANIVRKMTLSDRMWIPEVEDLPEHVEVSHQSQIMIGERVEEEEESEESVEEQVSEVSIPDKIRCIKFTNLEFFAEMFVDEIIDISVDVCKNLCNAALVGEGEDVVAEIPCICDAVKQPGESGGASLKASLPDSSSLSSVEKKKFSGWPTIKSFSVHGAKKKVLEFMGQWYFVQDWKYTVHYLGSYSDSISDYHLYQGMWSIPTKEYPIAQATATVFFTIEVSRVKPKFCVVNVTLQFEGSSSVYKAGQFEFIEQWLFNIIDSKLNLFRTLRF